MSTNVRRSGFEKFFRRKSSSPEPTKEPEKNEKKSNEDVSAKVESSTSKSGKISSEKSTDGKNAIDDATSQKTDGSKKSSKEKNHEEPEVTKKDDKTDNSEACKEYMIKDNVGQVKLTEIINNSIKEAVLNIVKESVCPLADSLSPKKPSKKLIPANVEETQDKENKPSSPNDLPSHLSSTNKTFESHLCRTQYQPSTFSRSPQRFNDQERSIVTQCNRELCPRIIKERKIKSTKQKDKKTRELCPKIPRPVKGSSHFKTDNRRMTGNVNIYICSEATENTNDPKKKPKDKCIEESESASETKTCASTVSVSTSKLVAALRKKQRKNLDNESLNCLCDIPECLTKPHCSVDKSDESDQVLCLCDDNVDAEFPDTQSSSSRDGCLCEEMKFTDLDCPCSDQGRDSDLASFDRYSYDKDDSWPCTIDDCPSYKNSCQRFNTEELAKNDDWEHDERCSCCDLKRCQKDRGTSVPCLRDREETVERKSQQAKVCRRESRETIERKSQQVCHRESRETIDRKSQQAKICHRESRERISRKQRDESGEQSVRCPCIVEEEDEDCCADPKEPEEEFTVCVNGPINVNPPIEEQQNKSRKGSTESDSGILKRKTSESRNSVSQLPPVSMRDSKLIEATDDTKVNEESAQVEPKSPKKNSKRSLDARRSQGRESSKDVSGEISKPSRESKISKGLGVPDGKRKDSFFYRSMKRAMSIVKTRKSEEEPIGIEGDKKIEQSSFKAKVSPEKSNNVAYHEENEKEPDVPSIREIDKVKPIPAFESVPNPERRSRSRISTAIASRRNSAAGSKDSSNMSISPCQPETDTKQESKEQCKCEKPPETCDCCCKKPEPVKDESCKCCTPKCRKVTSNQTVCCKKLETPKLESSTYCSTCRNPPERCECWRKKCEPIEAKPCKCCPRCRRPIAECKCCKWDNLEEEFCKCCCQPESRCCCDPVEKSRNTRSQPAKCRRFPEVPESCRQCVACCRPKDECRCQRRCQDRNDQGLKSMICIYCDNPQDICICRAPVHKCSQCCLPLDVCNCKPTPCCDCSGRQIVPSDDCNEQTICVTAWKPRRNVRRYFARSMDEGAGISDEDCACWEKPKPYGSDRLAYQKRGVFSDVMSELQQKISGSVCCNVCRKEPCCCCCLEMEPEDTIEMRPCLSTIAERRSPGRSQKRSRSKSPTDSCKCAVSPRRKNCRPAAPSRICGRCRTSPCRCRRNSKSPQNKPQAKCYYCKSLPCVCVPLNENVRPCWNADSSNRRRKERCSPIEGKTNDKIVISDNGCCGRESKRFISCPGNQQKVKKYCYRGNSTRHPLHTGECAR